MGYLNSQSSPMLMNGEVAIWHASLEQPAAVLAELQTVLSEEERTRAGRFHFQKHQNAFIAGRGILRLLLSGQTGIHPKDLQFKYTQHGKPFLAGSDIHFNLSHSGGIVLYGLSPDRQVGIDIEQIRPLKELEQIAKNHFSPEEYHQLSSVREDDRLAAFFRCWTRKEAFIKAIGEGISFPLQEFTVSLKAGYPAKLMSVRGSVENTHRWSMHDVEVPEGYAAALVVEGTGASITHRAWKSMEPKNMDESKPRPKND